MQIGRHSPKLVQIRKAFRQGTLTQDGLLPIEGPILLEEAQKSGLEIVDIFLRSGSTSPAVPAKELFEVPPDVFKSIQETEHSQGIVATVRPRQLEMSDVFGQQKALLLVLCRLQDPGNVGTILRVAEAFGATGCIAIKGTVSLLNNKVVRASAGSIFRIPYVAGLDLETSVNALRAREIRIVGTAPDSQATIDAWDWRCPTAVLIGNEGSGLNRDEVHYCDTVLRIPQKASVESLNSAVAAAVIVYEASKQRHRI
jgi:TrmH family RNA methyltransferase